MRFDWDAEKANANLAKHGISFDEVTELFSRGDDCLEIYDEEHSHDEDRFIAIGPVVGRLVVVVFTEWPQDTIRLISARPATRKEIELYRQTLKSEPDDGS